MPTQMYVSTALGENTFAIPFSDTVNAYVLSGTAVQVTVPAGATKAVFSGNDDFWVAGATFSIPSANITDGSAPELNPAVRAVAAGQTFWINGSGSVSVSFYE